ncbi:molybdenum cofactor cytidylyltransferase [Paenibacillus algorifonticola]|uniref:Molybdenum cofactor cytidylyltransferase n=2 Tax=Paenibacillus algorifonticola TaxID=684063 RepID=A0A1I1YJ67_9BACL|nr:molybdenum cofactor cytidylyltransferase [Paenibacillus algorifonticola]
MLGSQALHALLNSVIKSWIVVHRTNDELEWLAIPELERACWAAQLHKQESPLSAQGMSCSLRSGLEALLALYPDTDAVLIALADQPFVTARMAERLVEALERDSTLDYAAFSDGAATMPPALLRTTMFSALEELEGDQGARQLFATGKYNGKILDLNGEHDFALHDIDDEDSLQAAIDCWNRRECNGHE